MKFAELIFANGGKLTQEGDSVVAEFPKDWKPKNFVSSADVFKPKLSKPDDSRKVANILTDYAQGAANLFSNNKVSYMKIGPIPKGTPVNLISNLDLTYAGVDFQNLTDLDILASQYRFLDAVTKLTAASTAIKLSEQKGQQAIDTFMDIAGDSLIKSSKCNDFVVNRGHYFGTKYVNPNITEDDQKALVEYIKHF